MSFTFSGLSTLIRNAVSTGLKGYGFHHPRNLSPARNAEPVYSEANLADAIAELSKPTGDPRLDLYHEAYIGLLEKKLLQPVHAEGETTFRYIPTAEAIRIVEKILEGEGDDSRYP